MIKTCDCSTASNNGRCAKCRHYIPDADDMESWKLQCPGLGDLLALCRRYGIVAVVQQCPRFEEKP